MQTLKLKDWNIDDRPREKFLLKGAAALSDAELIAIILRSGTREQTVVDLAKHVLALSGNSLHNLGKIQLQQLRKIKGIGETKAISLLAALELGQRKIASKSGRPEYINDHIDVRNIMFPLMDSLIHEEFWVLGLNNANKLLAKQKIGHGGVSRTVADPKIIFKFALENLATQLILVHNHPSGNCFPSESDKKLTIQMKKAGELLSVSITDHVIIAGQEVYSFRENDLL